MRREKETEKRREREREKEMRRGSSDERSRNGKTSCVNVNELKGNVD